MAHSKYRKIALQVMNNPLDREKIARRESLISFLVASKVVDTQHSENRNTIYSSTKELTPAEMQIRKSSLLSQPIKRKMSALLTKPLN